ncbi:hypothetical protein MUK42_07934 [Musa troglodytarum]|uniref:Uncharacterized protein n=1 Tax=Musa troglodytarum TaxID=320322 RepID=A0A9E7JK40_9LILI|nr:hypothetical protein MUK42_07934 [Musa troglodytarum]
MGLPSTSSSSASSSSSPSVTTRVAALPSSPASSPSSDAEAARALEALMWPHDQDSILDERMVGILRRRYGIRRIQPLAKRDSGLLTGSQGLCHDARCPRPACAFPAPNRRILHLLAYFAFPDNSQLWRYLVAFTRNAITPTSPQPNLFLSCFRLFKGEATSQRRPTGLGLAAPHQ